MMPVVSVVHIHVIIPQLLVRVMLLLLSLILQSREEQRVTGLGRPRPTRVRLDDRGIPEHDTKVLSEMLCK